MDLLKWPTDSLYKFIAIAGLVGAGFLVAIAVSSDHDRKKVGTDFFAAELQRRVEHSTHEDTRKVYPPMVHWYDELPDPPNVDYLMGSKDDRAEWGAYVQHQIAAFSKYRLPAKTEEMQTYFERADIRRYFERHKGLTGEAYQKFVNGTNLERFAEMTAGERAEYDERLTLMWKHWIAVQAAWDEIDHFRERQWYSWFGATVLAPVTLIGFALWYVRVQRPQDRITQRDSQQPVHSGMGPIQHERQPRNKKRRR